MTKIFSKHAAPSLGRVAGAGFNGSADNTTTLLAFELLDCVDQALLLITSDRKLVYANRRAQDSLIQDAPFSLLEDLTVSLAHSAEALELALAAAVADGARSFSTADVGGVSYRISVKRLERPARVRPIGLFTLQACALLPTRSALVARYALTPVEGDLVLRLLHGAEVKDAAFALRISHHTARKYLKAIFFKLSVNRQVDLVRKILVDHYAETRKEAIV